VLLSGQKLTLDPLATITFELMPFRTYSPLPALLPLFKCILEGLFFESTQHRLRFCLDYLFCVKMADFLFYLQSETEKSGVDGLRQSYLFCKKFPGEKVSVNDELS
jgi:hypothetical protein